MFNLVLEKINSQSKEYEKHSNEWNIVNQLIDILAEQETSCEIVLQDLDIAEMNIKSLVNLIVSKRVSNDEEVMKIICDFYKIPVPQELPPEYWRKKSKPKSKAGVDFISLLGGLNK